MIYLDALTREDMPKIVEWRNQNIEGARTPYLLNIDMQIDFYEQEICNRDSKHRYWAVRRPIGEWEEETGPVLLGLSGITNIEWENSRGEIALLIDPSQRGKGYGKQALNLTLDQAFNSLNLMNIYGEVYECNDSMGFWEKYVAAYGEYTGFTKGAKWWNGKYFDGWCFNIRRTA